MNGRDGALSSGQQAVSLLNKRAAAGGLVVVLATLLDASGAASAQSAPPADEGGLEVVIVTATRREESIRDVPISISAFGEEQMEIQGIRSVDDIARLAPGVQFSRGGGFGTDLGSTISIRGVSSAAGQATTGVYIDDTPIQVGATVASGNFADNAYPRLFDVQRVEVLRGPQGTLFGSGSEGGTIRFITPAPSLTKSSAYVRSEISSTKYGAPNYEFGAAGGAPIIDGKLGFRASAWNRRDGGYVDTVDYYTGQRVQTDNNWTDSTSARVALAWQPIDQLTITPSVFYQRIKANGSSSFFLPSDGITGPLTAGGPNLPVLQQPYGNVGDGDYVDLRQTPQWAVQRLTLSALKIEYDIGKVDLLSNTSYYERKQHDQTDYSFIHAGNFSARLFPNPEWDVIANEDQGNRFFTQEVRLQSDDPDSRLKWVAGVFYAETSTYGNLAVANPHLGDMLLAGPLAGTLNCATADECVLRRFTRPLVDGLYSFIGNTTVEETQKAVFGQVDYAITDNLTATVGVRYAKMTNDFVNVGGGASSGQQWPTFKRGSAEANATTPKYMLSYKTDGGDLIYASASKGFRNGGSNAPVQAASCQASLEQLGLSEFPVTYDPDSVWSYELGSKFAFARNRVQVDLSVFQIDWEDQIRNIALNNCLLQFTTNVGATQSRGFDLSVQWRALDSLVLSLNGGWQEVKAKETIPSGTRNLVTEDDYLQGSQPTANAAVQYTFDAWQMPSYLRVDTSYTGKTKKGSTWNPLNAGYTALSPLTLFQDPSFTQTSLRLGTQLGDWDVSLFVNNLTNEQPLLFRNRTTLNFGSVPSGLLSATTLRPRTVGVTAALRF